MLVEALVHLYLYLVKGSGYLEDMARLAVAFACLLIDVVLCQIHLGPIGDAKEVTCYQCDGHGHEHSFPDCLNRVHKCHHDEVCRITYGDNHHTNIRCQISRDCDHEIANHLRNCTGGGVEARPNECQKCCATDDCVNDLVNLMKVEAATSPDLFCPGWCNPNDLQSCVNRGHRCHKDQFCEISQEEKEIYGECKPDHEYHHCSEELNRHSCNAHGGHHPGRCFVDCCTTNDCVRNTFGDYMSTTAAPTTVTVPTTATPGESLWERLHGDCKDQLVGDGCQNLMQTQDVCHDRLALSICPESCGLCGLINSTVCSDVVVNDGCKNLLQHENVCSDKLAVFICPNTCNLCDELVNSLITSLVNGNSTGMDVPATLLPPSADPSAYPTFDCNDLNGVDCGVLDGLCASSFVKVVCPGSCSQCGSQCHQNPDRGDGGGHGKYVTGNRRTKQHRKEHDGHGSPASTAAPAGSSSPAPVPASTMMPMFSTTVDNCADHLNGINCSDLANVCSSVMAMSVCPKFCGLC